MDKRCIDCGVEAPPTESSYTLIGARHGWRLISVREPDGKRLAHWRCPQCWLNFKASEASDKGKRPKP